MLSVALLLGEAGTDGLQVGGQLRLHRRHAARLTRREIAGLARIVRDVVEQLRQRGWTDYL